MSSYYIYTIKKNELDNVPVAFLGIVFIIGVGTFESNFLIDSVC